MNTILQLRKRRGLTLKELGGSSRHIIDVEQGRRMPGPRLLKRLAHALGLSVEETYDLCREACRAHGTTS